MAIWRRARLRRRSAGDAVRSVRRRSERGFARAPGGLPIPEADRARLDRAAYPCPALTAQDIALVSKPQGSVPRPPLSFGRPAAGAEPAPSRVG